MPPTLGQRLKHAREKLGLSLRDVQHKTRIPVPRLQDLEDDKLNSFGGMTYARSFLKTYSTMLGVDAEEVLNQIKTPPLGGTRDYRYLVESQGPWIIDRRERHAPMATAAPLNPGKSFIFATLVCLVFALLIGGGVLANAYLNSKAHQQAVEMVQSQSLLEPEHVGTPDPIPVPPKAEPVFEDAVPVAAAPAAPPKAEAVAPSQIVPPKAEPVR